MSEKQEKNDNRYPVRQYNVTIFIFGISVFLGLSVSGGIYSIIEGELLNGIVICAGFLFIFVLPLLVLLLGNYAWYEFSSEGITYKFPFTKTKKMKWSEVIEFKYNGADFMLKDDRGTKIIFGSSTPNLEKILNLTAKHLYEAGKNYLVQNLK